MNTEGKTFQKSFFISKFIKVAKRDGSTSNVSTMKLGDTDENLWCKSASSNMYLALAV